MDTEVLWMLHITLDMVSCYETPDLTVTQCLKGIGTLMVHLHQYKEFQHQLYFTQAFAGLTL